MSMKKITKYLHGLQLQKKYDNDFVKALIDSCEKNEEGEITAEGVLELISKRYAKNKKNKT